ncbi:30S ribosomal protein S17e [Nanoarchaeota archaeon]
MGRIKTKLMKRTSRELMSKYEDKFTTDFAENKVAVDKVAQIKSKKLRNIIAGYLTRLKKRAE